MLLTQLPLILMSSNYYNDDDKDQGDLNHRLKVAIEAESVQGFKIDDSAKIQ